MTSIERDVQIAREMHKQGVSSLSLQGPLGDAVRAEVRPHIEKLVEKKAFSVKAFGILYGMSGS